MFSFSLIVREPKNTLDPSFAGKLSKMPESIYSLVKQRREKQEIQVNLLDQLGFLRGQICEGLHQIKERKGKKKGREEEKKEGSGNKRGKGNGRGNFAYSYILQSVLKVNIDRGFVKPCCVPTCQKRPGNSFLSQFCYFLHCPTSYLCNKTPSKLRLSLVGLNQLKYDCKKNSFLSLKVLYKLI